ncbi:putative sulfate/molybdate transporter [Candidatus Laterigemmans baculatus]|uniref:putative sulfate/molybdate transporter n=1 Tax=Candidatus Laterigemmans baculatus TaxID=2770505 RepID=UPI0013DB63BA|nr:putative sulfate/molybdate transporter [Candidatus Laterigemmans baculatus]
MRLRDLTDVAEEASPGLLARVRANLREARFNRHEVAGSLGDLGTFLPLLVGMAAQNGLDFATGLFFAGFFNLLTGLLFAIPLAVQPMKAIAAVAITEGLTPPQIAAAGASVGGVILLLGLTGWIEWLHRAVPRGVVRGLQLAVGLSLLVKGIEMVRGTQAWWGPDSYLTGLAAAAVVVLLISSRKLPAALVLFAAGVALAALGHPEAVRAMAAGFDWPQWSPPQWSDFRKSFPAAALPQIPLTTLNSVIAVCALSEKLFPDRGAGPREVSISVALMNFVACGFGGMPMCHGAGGLAGQHRFGARSNGAILFLGAAKMSVAVVFGATLMAFCQAFPLSILGVMLAISGFELGMAAAGGERRSEFLVILLTAALCLGLGNIAAGFVLGWGLAGLLTLATSGRRPI